MLKELIKLFIRTNGRNPNNLELLQLKFKAAQQSGKGKVLEFPRDRITDWRKPRPTTGKEADVIGPPHGYGAGHGTADPIQAQRIRQGFSTQSKLNHWSQNQKQVSDFVGRKNAEFNFLNKEDQTKVLEMFEAQIKKHMPKERKAGGGIAGMLGEPTYVDDNHRVPFDSGNMVLPKEKPSASYRILEMLDKNKKAAFNTLGAETMFNLIYEHAPKAFEKGEISEEDYNEAMKAFEPKGITALKKLKAEEEAYLDKYQTGGRVPFSKGKLALLQGLGKMMDNFFPGTTKIGKTSKPMADKTQLRKAIADFQERQKNKIIDHSGDAPKAGEGRFTKAEAVIMRLENTIKGSKGKKDKESKYVLETFPNFIKEIKAKPELANNKNVWDNLMGDLPKDQQFVVYGDDTVDFFTQSKFGPHNIASKKAFHKKHPYLTEEEAVKISSMEPNDQVMELKRLQTLRTTKHADGGIAGGRVGLLWGGGVWKTLIKNLAKERGVNPSTYLKITNYKALPNDVKKYLSKEEFERMKKGRIEMFENWVEMAKTRKAFLENIEQGKKTPAAPIFEHLEKSFKSPVPPGVTDKDILQGEFILKNLKTKGRKLNASGGLAEMLGE